MGKCEKEGISISFYSPRGRYLATAGSVIKGNVLLRREQYRIADNEKSSLGYAKNFILGKTFNSKEQLRRLVRDHPMQVDCELVSNFAERIEKYLQELKTADSKENLRGIEGLVASEYFKVFDHMILQRKDTFHFEGRNRRPPTDRVNAMMSFAYSLLAGECAAALLSVGLDPYVGFLHVDRPGRKSLALDLMEELRSILADRFVLTIINNKMVEENDFVVQESGAVIMKEDFKRQFLAKWQQKRREEIKHPYLKEKVPWGLVPYAQSMLLSRSIRGDIDQYPPFFWR